MPENGMTKRLDQQKQMTSVGIAGAASLYEGPLPRPEDMAKYEKICPGAARDIIDFAKTNQDHIIWMDREGLKTARMQLRILFIFGLMGQIGTAGIALSGFIFAFLKLELAKEGFVFSACIAGYLIWWKTRHSKQGGNEKSE